MGGCTCGMLGTFFVSGMHTCCKDCLKLGLSLVLIGAPQWSSILKRVTII